MPLQRVNHCDLHYETHGAGRETLLFAHGLLFSTAQFHHQIEHFKKHYHILAYDHRGQGRSAPIQPSRGLGNSGNSMLWQLVDDAASLIKARQLAPVHFVGASLGAVVGLLLAIRQPKLIRSLTLAGTDGNAESNHLGFHLLSLGVRFFGVSPFLSPLMHWFFGDAFLNDDDRIEERLFWQERLSANRKSVIRSVAMLPRSQLLSQVSQIQCPTLLLAGTEDRLASLEWVRRLQTLIPNAHLKLIYHAGHNPLLEEPYQCHHAMEQFLRLEVGGGRVTAVLA
jgi:pimeloyl-ACP methyl ester carboxylesterase